MNWIYRNRIGIFLVSCGLSAVAYLLFLYLDLLRLSALMILMIFSCSRAAIKLGAVDLENVWKRFQNYFFSQQLANQYILRALGFFVVLYKTFTDSALIQLALACLASHLITMFIIPTFSGRAFRLEVGGLGFPETKADNDRHGLMNLSTSIFESLGTTLKFFGSALEPLHILIFCLSPKETNSILIWTFTIHIIINFILLTYSLITLISTFLSQSIKTSKEEIFKKLDDYAPELILYFSADSVDSLYQVEQWLPSIKSSGHQFAIVTREHELLNPLNELSPDIPVLWIRTFTDIEKAIPNSVKGILYVNNGMRNFHALRLAGITHVQLLHGESDKGSSSSKVTRAYDLIAVAGETAIRRYEENGISIPRSQFRIIGRPVTDSIIPSKQEKPIETILYAPTWEGHNSDSNYSSVKSIALPMLDWLSRNQPHIKIIVKPHPLTGSREPELLEILEEIKQIISLTNDSKSTQNKNIEANYSLHEFVGKESDLPLHDIFNQVDAVVCDISSVASDFLASNKPMFICDARGEGQSEIRSSYPTTQGSYIVNTTHESWNQNQNAFTTDPLRGERVKARKEILGDFTGSSTSQFHSLLNEIANKRATANIDMISEKAKT